MIHDPALGERRLSYAEASKHLSGVAVEAWPLDEFAPKDERTRLPLSAFFGRVRGTAHALAQIFALSVILEICLIAAPFYMQLAMDQVIASGDVDLLVMLAVGFGLVTAISVAAKAIRSLTTLSLQNTLHFAMGSRLFHHLVRLPLAYFEKRHIGDILSRFVSLEPIRNIVAEGLITAAIDGLMGDRDADRDFPLQPAAGRVVVSLAIRPLPGLAAGALPSVPRAQRGSDPQQGAGELDLDRDAAGDPKPEAVQPRERAGEPMAEPLRRCHQRGGPHRPHQDSVRHVQRSDLRPRKHRDRLSRRPDGAGRAADDRHDLRVHRATSTASCRRRCRWSRRRSTSAFSNCMSSVCPTLR